MEMRRMVRQRLLAAQAAAAVIIYLLVWLFTDLASEGGSLSPSIAPEVFFARDSSYGLELLHARDSCGDPGTAHAALSKGSKDDGGSTTLDENPYFVSSLLDENPYFVCPKTSPLADDVCVDYTFGHTRRRVRGIPKFEDFAVDFFADFPLQDIIEMKSGGPVMVDRSNNGTIMVDRSSNMTVDFTVPYTDCGPSCSFSPAPIQWLFLNPLTKELWLATMCFVFFTGFVFWMIERSINPEFQGSSLTQFSTALYFVLSTLTFSHGQILRSPLSKIVLVVWCLAVLVLVQSYVSNLSSMLAAEASANNGSSSAATTAPLTLRSLSGLFVVTGCILAFMLLISLTRSAYAAYTSRVRASVSQQSTPQNDEENGSVVVPELPVQEVTGDEEAGGVIQDSMSNASEPAPDVYVQIEMTSTSNGVGGAL